MKQSEKPLWRKSMLDGLALWDIMEALREIGENGDMYGHDNADGYQGSQDGYYQEYKELFDDLALGAYELEEAMAHRREYYDGYEWHELWNDMTVALLGRKKRVLGFDAVMEDYHAMLDPWQEDCAVEEAEKRLMRLTKKDLVKEFRFVLCALLSYLDIKCAHDCLTAIVEELDNRAAAMIGRDGRAQAAPRMWVE